jgi:hypothetical protein
MKTVKTYEDFVKKTNEESEGKMYKQKLKDIISNTQKFMDMLGDEEDMEAWVQDKITIADHNMEAIANYYSSEKGNKTSKTPITPMQVKGDMATGGMLKDEK